MRLFQKYKLLVFSILFPALLLLMYNSVANWHTHHLAGGKIAVHSHPFKQPINGEKQHQHSEKEFFFLQQLTGFLFVVCWAIVAVVAMAKKTDFVRRLKLHYRYQNNYCLLSDRAPPYPIVVG